MPTAHPSAVHPVAAAEDIDEDAARRSIRVTIIVMSVGYLLAALASVAIARQLDHRPAGAHDGMPAWAAVLLVVVGESFLWQRRWGCAGSTVDPATGE